MIDMRRRKQDELYAIYNGEWYEDRQLIAVSDSIVVARQVVDEFNAKRQSFQTKATYDDIELIPFRRKQDLRNGGTL